MITTVVFLFVSLVDAFYWSELILFYSYFAGSFCYEQNWIFFKSCVLYVCKWSNDFLLYSPNIANHIGRFSNVKPIVHSWGWTVLGHKILSMYFEVWFACGLLLCVFFFFIYIQVILFGHFFYCNFSLFFYQGYAGLVKWVAKCFLLLCFLNVFV